MKTTTVITSKEYTSKGRAIAAARRIWAHTYGYFADGSCWTMDNVEAYELSSGGWCWHLVFEAEHENEDAMAEIEAQERLDMEEAQEEPNAEADQEELDKVKDMTGMELSMAASTGKGALAEAIDRMETALRHLKELQREYKAGDPKEDAFYMAERLRRAANEIHGYLCTSLALELAATAGAMEQLAKAACRLDMDGE